MKEARPGFGELTPVDSPDDLARLESDVHGLLVRRLSNQTLALVAARHPQIRFLLTDGNNSVSDDGVVAVAQLRRLEVLDLEWSRVTDAALPVIAEMSALRWVDLGFTHVTAQGLAWLRRARPDLEIEPASA
jgi:hypothetical protein